MNHNNNDLHILNQIADKGMISQMELQAVLSERELTGERVGQILINNGFVTRKQIVSMLHENLDPAVLINPTDSDLVDPEVLLKYRVMLLAVTEDVVYLCTDSPHKYVEKSLKETFGNRTFAFRPFDPHIFHGHLEQLKHQVDNKDKLDGILRQAVVRGASDIHLVAKDGMYVLMFRYLGVREVVRHLTLEKSHAILATAKDRARIDIAERRIPQDGGFRTKVVERFVDFRVATIPTVNGETMVIRVLDSESVNPKLDQLGISPQSLEEWRKAIGYTSGICLVCGPTGSGKSVTMNASVRELDRFGKTVYTVEDPVELRLAFLNQVETNAEMGLDFNRALRAFMRGDPDIIVVGEIRDKETAELAINAARTGHLVIATLHSDSPQGAVTRLETIGVELDDFSSHLRGIMVQQLVRTVCQVCLGNDNGCPECESRRYTGRMALSEAVCIKDTDDVYKVARGEVWWHTLQQHGMDVIENNLSTREEIERVLGTSMDKVDKKPDRHVMQGAY